MKLNPTLLLLMSLFSLFGCKSNSTASAQTVESAADRQAAYAKDPDALYPIRLKEKWGYINRNGEVVIAPAWAEANDFYENKAVVAKHDQEQNTYGFIDKNGKEIIPPKYQKADRFSEGLAAVRRNDLYGYIDATGKEIIAFQFEEAGMFYNGYAAIALGGWTGFIDKSGQIVIQPAYTMSVNYSQFVDGIAPVFGADEMTGYIDTMGEWAINPIYASAANFREGKAWAMLEMTDPDSQSDYGTKIRGGFIGTDGNFIIDPVYDFGWDFSEGYATVWARSEDKMSKIWSVIDGQGERLLTDLSYRNVGAMVGGMIPIQDEALNWGFINIRGEVVIPPIYVGINHFRNGLARMESGTAFKNTFLYINMKGEVVWKEK